MSSKRKQNVTSDKKKFSFFSLLRPKGVEHNGDKNETSTAAVEIAQATGTAPDIHSSDVDKPSSSTKGQFRLFSRYFKKGDNADTKKITKKTKAVSQEEQKMLETLPEIPAIPIPEVPQQETQSTENKENVVLIPETPEVVGADILREAAATKIQALIRGHQERQKYELKRENAIKVEALARGFLARKKLAGMNVSAEDSSEVGEEENTAKVASENLITFS